MSTRQLITTMVVLLAAMMLPSIVFADKNPAPLSDDTATAKIAAQLQDQSKDPFDYTRKSDKKKALAKAEKEYPVAYDLRNVNGTSYVTPVKFQNPFGTCWGFAAIAAAESSILGSGLAAQDGYDANTLDMSEKHLAYFLGQAISDPENSQYGEGTHADENVTVKDLLNGGGIPFFATSLFASGIGPNLENKDLILEYKGKNGWTQKRITDGKVIDYCYDDEDDWSIPEDWRFRQSYVLKESFMLPSPARVDKKAGKYTYNPAGTAAIKEMLMNKRAVQIGYHADASIAGKAVRDGKYISKNWAHYTYNSSEVANHAVTIVGYDDKYDKSNFIEGHQPPENGAWLVKNSWGSEERPFPNRGPGWGIEANGVQTGYFWLSYYDKTLSLPEALAFDKSNVGKMYYIDEYDFMPVSDIESLDLSEKQMMANVFRAEECEMLYQVSCRTTAPGTKVVNEIYILPDDFTSPTDGKLVDRAEATFEFGGFHTMDLQNPDVIQKGQYYAIVQTLITPDGKTSFNISKTSGIKKTTNSGGKTWVEGVINPKESYLYTGGKWHDFSSEKYREELFRQTATVMAFDNFPIKGYCTPAANIYVRVNGKTSLGIDDESTLSLVYKGDAGDPFNAPQVKWEMAEGGSDFFTLTPDSERQHVAKITGKKVGSTLLFITVDGIGTKAVRLIIPKRKVSATLFSEENIYNGKNQTPKPTVKDEDGNVIPASHYTLSYKNNRKCGEAKVYVKIKPGDSLYEGSITGYFDIFPRKAVITGLKTGKRSLTVKVKDQKKSGVKYYNVSYRVKGTSAWSEKRFKASSGTSLVLKNLKKGKRYQVRVYAEAKKEIPGKYSKMKTSKAIR